MKRTITVILALLFLMVGCGQQDAPDVPSATTVPTTSAPTANPTTASDPTVGKPEDNPVSVAHKVTLSDSAQDQISAVLDSKWINSATYCAYDFEFAINGLDLRYHSDCGTIIDIAGNRSLTLSDEDRGRINTLLETNISAVKLMEYAWSGYGMSTKTIQPGEMANELIRMLEDMEETEQVVPKISDDSVTQYSTFLPVDRGTMWIEIGANLYRITPDFTQLCRVETHLGEGYVLNLTPEFTIRLAEAWQYYPRNYYSGTYNNETNEITLEHKYNAPSTVRISIKSLEVQQEFNANNKIILEVTSSIDQTVSIRLDCYQSDDNLGLGDGAKLALTQDQSETVELCFIGFNCQHMIDIQADNTVIHLVILP